ncbi:hypothetical protein GCM10008927_27090 [Amylibacter ulvae]|uniref:Transposase n=1 Tax=Paramylibacter ulvae TaxID=1651968 RepID=A0ABQ3D5Q0_9RHOB|nr:hypothetical protein GCM10008927_27090 [Amylibacter ulvae]
MRHNKWRARSQAAVHIAQSAQTFLPVEKMQGQQTCRAVKRTIGCVLDIAFMKGNATHLVAQNEASLIDHVSGRVYTIEPPVLLHVDKRTQFEATARTQDQYPTIRRDTLSQQETGHMVHIAQARNVSRDTVPIAR